MEQTSHSLSQTGLAEYERLLSLLDQRRFDEALLRAEVMLETAEVAPQTRARTHNLICWALCSGLKRPSPKAVLHGEEAVRLAEELCMAKLALQALCNLGNALFQTAEYEGAADAYRRMERQATAAPSLLPHGRILALQGLAQVDLAQGEAERALELLQQAEALCAQGEGESPHLLPEVLRRQALVLLRLGRPRRAMQVLARLDEPELAESAGGLWWRTELGLTRARAAAAQGYWKQARRLVVITIALAQELADLPVLAQATCLLAIMEGREGCEGVTRRARKALLIAIQSGRRDVVDEVRDALRPYLRV